MPTEKEREKKGHLTVLYFIKTLNNDDFHKNFSLCIMLYSSSQPIDAVAQLFCYPTKCIKLALFIIFIIYYCKNYSEEE